MPPICEVRRPQAGDGALRALFRKAKHIGKDLRRRPGFRQQEGDAVDAADGEFLRDGTIAPGRLGLRAGNRHERQRHAVRILEGQGSRPEACCDRFMAHAHGHEALQPEAECCFRNAQCGFLGLARAEPARGHMVPGEERDDAAGATARIAEVEVIGAGIVEVHRPLDEAQAECPGVEIEIAARIAGDCRNVMDARGAHECLLSTRVQRWTAHRARSPAHEVLKLLHSCKDEIAFLLIYLRERKSNMRGTSFKHGDRK